MDRVVVVTLLPTVDEYMVVCFGEAERTYKPTTTRGQQTQSDYSARMASGKKVFLKRQVLALMAL